MAQEELNYLTSPTQTAEGANGIRYAYRRQGNSNGGRPLVLLQHFRGNLENWDPLLIDALAATRDVVTFDNVGVAATTGSTPSTIAQMADDAIVFIDALGLGDVDLLGFSIGSFVAQEMALTRPALVRKVVLASTAPQGAPGMHGWAPDVIKAVGEPNTDPAGYLQVFFSGSQASLEAGKTCLGRIYARQQGRDAETTWETRNAQYDAIVRWGIPNLNLMQRLAAMTQPVFIANGDSDPMILPWYSHLTAALIPTNILKIYPDAAHGFLFQHATEFVADVEVFLSA